MSGKILTVDDSRVIRHLIRSSIEAHTNWVVCVVSPNGTVRLVEVKGGHPVLAEAAVDAVSKWKWEPADHESREPVELKFMPAH